MLYAKHRCDLTFITCDRDKHIGADAQEGEHYHKLNARVARSFKREADCVDEGDDRPAVENHYQDHRWAVLMMSKSFFLIPQKHQLKKRGGGKFWKSQ